MYKLRLLISAVNGAEYASEAISCILQNYFVEKNEDRVVFEKKDYDRLKDNIETLIKDIYDIKKVFN